MGASTSLSSAELIVIPGGEARTSLRIRNNGSVVDQFDLSVLGDAAAWASVEPPTISLFPGAEESVDVVFRPGKTSAIVSGRASFAVKATSREDVQGSSVEEGVIDVVPYDERTAELIPRTSKGKRSAVHDLAVDNRGNAPITVHFTGMDPQGTLQFEFEPPQITVAPGTAQFAKVKLKPAQHFWRGANKTLPFVVMVEEDGQPPMAVDGSMVQLPILPKWFWKAVLAALLVIILLLVLWFTLVKPQIKTSAQDAVKPIDNRLNAANIPALPAGGGGGGGGGGGATTTTTTTAPTTVTTIPAGTASGSAFGAPFDIRLEVQTGTAPSAAYSVPTGQTFALTDIVFQNPQGDTGRLLLKRNDTVLLEISLENFRLHDLHTISPYIFNSGQTLTIAITCTAPGPGASQCDDSASLSGFQK